MSKIFCRAANHDQMRIRKLLTKLCPRTTERCNTLPARKRTDIHNDVTVEGEVYLLTRIFTRHIDRKFFKIGTVANDFCIGKTVFSKDFCCALRICNDAFHALKKKTKYYALSARP